MNRQTYNLIFKTRDTEDLIGLEVGPSDNPMIAGDHVTYMDRDGYNPAGLPNMVTHDLESPPYPFPDNTFDVIAMREVLEHVCPKSQIPVMNELWRIMKPTGRLILTVPYYTWHGAHSTPDHCKCFTEYSFVKYEHESYRGKYRWDQRELIRVREKDRLRYMPVTESGHRIKRVWLRHLIYRVLSYMPSKCYTRNLYFELQPNKQEERSV